MNDKPAPTLRVDAIFRSCGLVGDLSRARLMLEGLLADCWKGSELVAIGSERERCTAIIRYMGTGHADKTEALIREIERGLPLEEYRP
jgi:hypothetical protein